MKSSSNHAGFLQLALVAIVAIVAIVVLVMTSIGTNFDLSFSSIVGQAYAIQRGSTIEIPVGESLAGISLAEGDVVSQAATLPADLPSAIEALVGSLVIDGAITLSPADFNKGEAYMIFVTEKSSFRVWKLSLDAIQQEKILSFTWLVKKLSGTNMASDAVIFVWRDGDLLRTVEMSSIVVRSLK